MNVLQTCNKFRISNERKVFTKRILNSLTKTRHKISLNEIYLLRYTANELSTDKWHQIALVYITEIKNKEFCGYNILYLPEKLTLPLLIKGQDNSNIINQLEHEISHGFKQYEIARKIFIANKVQNSLLIERKDWGMIPILERSYFGRLNFAYLKEDWDKENKVPLFKKKKHALKNVKKDDTFEVSDDLIKDPKSLIFDKESNRENLVDLDDDI